MGKNVEHIQHIKSNVVLEGKPKLPQSGTLVEGELAVNYAKGVETISIENASGEVVTFSSDNYYSEQKLGSAFTGTNSAVTVTEYIEENEEIISSALNDINTRVDTVSGDVETLKTSKVDVNSIDQTIDSGTSASTDAVSTSAVYEFVTSHAPSVTIDQTIDSGTSASTDAVSTSAVYEFVTSYTPSITVDQVLDDSTSASTNPVSSKAVYDAVTDNELVWTNAYVTLSGAVSAHTEDEDIHVTELEKIAWGAKADSATTLAGYGITDAYTKSQTSGATEISTALSGKADSAHTHTLIDITDFPKEDENGNILLPAGEY